MVSLKMAIDFFPLRSPITLDLHVDKSTTINALKDIVRNELIKRKHQVSATHFDHYYFVTSTSYVCDNNKNKNNNDVSPTATRSFVDLKPNDIATMTLLDMGIIAGGYIIHMVDPFGMHRAALIDDLSAIGRHLAYGQAVDTRNRHRQTPLHSASLRSQIATIELLAERGADLNASQSDGKTPLHIAADCGDRDVTEVLLRKGAAVDSFDKHGSTSLHYATRRKMATVAKMLMASGASADVPNSSGQTPLHTAAWCGSIVIVELLVANGADVTATDECGHSALQVAEEALLEWPPAPEYIAIIALLTAEGGI